MSTVTSPSNIQSDTIKEDQFADSPKKEQSTNKPSELSFTLEDNISTISVIRQQELYSMPILNESSDIFSNNTISNDNLKSKLENIKETLGEEQLEDDNLKFWYELIEDYSNQILRERRIDELEQHLIEGIPESLRSLVYLKTLQVRYKLEPSGYENLLKRANSSSSTKNQELFLESLPVDADLKEVLKIFNYYTNEVIINTTKLEAINNDPGATPLEGDTEDLPPNNFVIHLSKLISSLPNISKEELLSLLLKFNKLFVNLIKDEFFYKVNRSLEDLASDVFLHLSKQGINLINFYKKILFNFFNEQIENTTLLYKILDFVVFQGFDFIPRVLVTVFATNGERILSLQGTELNNFLSSKHFFSVINEADIPLILKIEPQIIKFENEYHLLHANSLNRNNNELTNLKSVNDDLIIKINDLKQQLNNLSITHTEILEQSKQFNDQLKGAGQEKQLLTQLKDELQEKYENLTMKENLKNTINANKDFSARNTELESQIADLKKSIEDKTSKLAKYSTN
ncbi:hypothetical protein HYPBUDRAFT_136662 [Hyphopichia burtonii NRRL Y-1933]|uniref:Rab-GAP TBC domain-containing protein n=1 Tax=Hyphopichia burtonii NRRL Y-1933 TaxID=984485 RepID=A0A1E4RJP8_9ASCO|nr:hypothetical protein HYPBUDRAFT_136662 [Hyphopichia burtonii NRRL Y-1933]ODV67450.1 hypothetical protein HYPBUDRAFT_136662 [Hyphopichia burtonii NRRL Y-1933]